MELNKAIEIVKSFKGKSFSDIIKIDDYNEAIVTVSKHHITDCYQYIPSKLQYIGLYPHTMKTFDIDSDIDSFDMGLLEEISIRKIKKKNEKEK